ncbi:MAG: hydroxylamine reductase [Rhodospirillales bacterium]|nr:hydroxylamine reductase [Rhodospirillales bacterium]
MTGRHWLRRFGAVAGILVAFAMAQEARADIPKELYEGLGIKADASPKQLYDKLVERNNAPYKETGGKGAHGKYWEPIPISKYFDPVFYKPPTTVKEVADGKACYECHAKETPGAVAAYKKSAHADLDAIRKLPDGDPRAYKKAKLEEVEKNLRSIGKLGANEKLQRVGCIDCHVDVGAQKGDHRKDLRMPDVTVCGTCHLQEFAERESERDTQTWPHNQWPKGQPSHALGYWANVDLATWAAMEEREIAEGCTMCHIQNKCDTCHTRHQFSAVEARKPEACAICHNGVDHNEYENFLLSKHGAVYQSLGDTWNWDVPLKDAIAKGGQTAPTCAFCHMEYKGKFGHNVVRKVRWAFNPTPAIADNLDHPWFEARKEAWVETCTNCHSESFGRAYLEMVDKGTKSGLAKEQEARKVVEKLYADGLLTGQKTNRPAPPAPEVDAPGGFFQLFWAKGNNPSAIEREFVEMWEHDLIKLYKGLAHANPGGFTYSEGWAPMMGRYARIMDEDTKLREMHDLKQRLAKLEEGRKTGFLELDSRVKQASVGSLGGGLLFAGSLALWWQRRRGRHEGDGR